MNPHLEDAMTATLAMSIGVFLTIVKASQVELVHGAAWTIVASACVLASVVLAWRLR